ncbi:reverse transcriptase domain-containing protein [Tanacetum coccineum]
MDELHARKVAISIQWNHWQTMIKKDLIRPINSLRECLKVPGRRGVCQQAAKDILPGTYDYCDNESADKADTVKSKASRRRIFGRTMEEEGELLGPWILFTDGSSCIDGFGAGSILINPKWMEFTYALRIRFKATNNEAEYEALISGSWNK